MAKKKLVKDNMSPLMKNINELAAIAEEDLVKFINGNNSAGARVRKSLQGIKKVAQDLRIAIQDKKNSEK
jgi:hypothetical protein